MRPPLIMKGLRQPFMMEELKPAVMVHESDLWVDDDIHVQCSLLHNSLDGGHVDPQVVGVEDPTI